MDTSNYQPRNLSALILEHDIKHVITRLFLPEEKPSQTISVAQLRSARYNDCTVGGYHWCYDGLNPEKSVDDAIAIFNFADVGRLPILWHDIEPYHGTIPSIDWIRASVYYCLAQGVRPGIYIGKWVVDAYYPNGELAEFDQLPFWIAWYDHDPDIDPIDLGFEYIPGGQQYTDVPVDLNMMFKKYTEIDMAMTEEEKQVVRDIIGPLRTWALAAKKRADATEQIGAGQDWQFLDPFMRRLELENADYAARLEALIS